MDNCSRKLDFLSQSLGRMDSNYNGSSRKLVSSQPHLNIINDSSVEFMSEASAPYFENDDALQSSVEHEDEDRLIEQESNLSAQKSAVELAKNCSENFIYENRQNIETMFNKYKQLGNELERNLLSLGDQNALRKNQLSKCMRDYEFLIKQKEKNKKCLVDLQIKMENLDTLKQNAKNENEIYKTQRSENIGQLFQTLFANDEYIKNTQNKFKEILLNDSKKVSSFIAEIKEEILNQHLLGDKYIQEMNNFLSHYESILKDADEKESNIDLKLDYVVQQCHFFKCEKEAQESELKCKKEILGEFQEKMAELKQKKELLQNELSKNDDDNNMLRELLSKTLDQIYNEKKSVNERYSEMCSTTKALYIELNEREKLVGELTRKSTQLIKVIENVRKEKLGLLNDLSEKELKLHNLKEESENVCQSLLINSQINDLLRMEDDLLSKKLYFEKCIELKCNQQEELKKKIEESEILLNEILNKSSQELQMKVELDVIYNETCKMLEEAKINLLSSISTEKIDNSEKRLKELEDLYSKHKEELAKLNNELECVDSDNTLVMKEYDDILVEQSSIGEKQKTLLLEKDKQNVHLLSMENLKKYLSDLEDEYFSLLSSKEANLVLDELKEELDKIMSEHKIGEQCNNDQLNSISDSFNSQLKILNDRMNTMKIENEEAIRKKIIQSTRFRKAIPRIEEAIQSTKNLISEKIPLLIDCIDKRLEYINNLIEVYKAARLEYKGSNGKNIDAKVVMNSIEKSLGKVMEHMAAVYEGPKLNASENLNKYQQIFANVRKKYLNLQLEMKDLPVSEVVTKLTELAACIYGGLGIPPRASMNESTQSSQRTLTSEDTIMSFQ